MKFHRIVILLLLPFSEAVDPPVAAPVATPVAFEVASEGDPPVAAPAASSQTDEETAAAPFLQDAITPALTGGGKNPLFFLVKLVFGWLKNGGFEKIIDLIIGVGGGNGKGGKDKGKGGGRRNGRRHRRAAAAGQCQLFETKGVTTAANPSATQQDVQSILGHMQDGTSFSVSNLRSLYLSLLSGLDLDGTTQNDLEVLVEDALTTIDLNGDGWIDATEMSQVQLPREMGDFLFDDVMACTSSNFQTSSGEECVTSDNVVDFLNQFYAGTEVVSADLAQEIRDNSGTDACYTRNEFEAAFGGTTPSPLEKESLSAGVAAHQQSTVAWTAAAGAVGTAALYVAGM